MNITLKPFCLQEASGFDICSKGKPFARVIKNHKREEWCLIHIVTLPKYLGGTSEAIAEEMELTFDKKELLAMVQKSKDKIMSKYKLQIAEYHTEKLKKQLSRY